ncbi:MAG TPA: zinc ribbon domain-containing protein [Blastocatellia bacterium]|nr:zinc ribbon domain-containing protein [Blastocatellia bacterium]
MYCPECGTPANDNQKFCRACGLSLVMHAQLLWWQRLINGPDETPVTSRDLAQLKRHRVLYRAAFILALAGGVLMLNTGMENLFRWGGSLGLLAAGITIMAMCREVPFLFYRPQFPELAISHEAESTLLSEGRTTARLAEMQVASRASVTEHTTALLRPNTEE